MKKVAMFAGRTRKAIGTAVTGVYVWLGLVIQSPAAHISATEWYVLAGVGVSVAAVYGLTNDSPPPEERANVTVEPNKPLATGGILPKGVPYLVGERGPTTTGNPQGDTR